MRLVLSALLACSLFAQNPAVTVTIDASAGRHAIDARVYGIAYGDATTLPDLNVPLNRYGGNNTSRYNWQLNADNRANDWYYESIAESSATAGERGDTFIRLSRTAQAEPMITIPMIGWVAKLGANRGKLASFSQAKYGAQTGSDAQWFPDAGNGILKATNQNITGNDPNDANVPADALFQKGWVQHLVGTFGAAANGGLKYYILDNEHSIWHGTHRDVHPTGASMDEIKQKMVDYAAAIKSVDPNAVVVGPEEWGWSGYLYSGYDQQYGSVHGWSSLPDRNAHGGQDYLPWLLAQLKVTSVAGGLKPLDIFTVHYYPQGGEFGDDTSTTMQLLRNKSTRSLWDPNYVDPTWINAKVMLIPRLKNWVSTYYYPGTPVGITEYNWGAESHINGATTQADILGIFGREGLDVAARWTTPAASTPTYKAMKMYRNYDGNKSTFGDTSVSAVVPNPDNLSAFAAVRSGDGAMTVMVINKVLSGSTPVTLSLGNFSGNGVAQVYQLTAANAITRLADLAYSGITVSATVPQQSITLFVLPSGTANVPPNAVMSANPASGTAPLTVTFNASGSSDPDGSISSYSWSFGDGGTATGLSASHTYSAAGTYSARLTVTDNRGATGSATTTISVGTNPATIAAPSNLTAAESNHVVTLTWRDNSSNETGFQIERAPAGTSNFVQVGTATANATTWNQTASKGTYIYRLRAVNSTTGVNSPYSNTVQIRVKQ
jgi:PKD repeat protein